LEDRYRELEKFEYVKQEKEESIKIREVEL
jgi:hypothetical protein